jgi:hypothetical protein
VSQNLKIELIGDPICSLTRYPMLEKGPQMKFTIIPAAFALVLAGGWLATPAHAAGCVKGAAVGALAGHVAGHHGALGAGAGCVVGHHEANKNAKATTAQPAQGSTSGGQTNTNSGR